MPLATRTPASPAKSSKARNELVGLLFVLNSAMAWAAVAAPIIIRTSEGTAAYWPSIWPTNAARYSSKPVSDPGSVGSVIDSRPAVVLVKHLWSMAEPKAP